MTGQVRARGRLRDLPPHVRPRSPRRCAGPLSARLGLRPPARRDDRHRELQVGVELVRPTPPAGPLVTDATIVIERV
jgi:hypothetical protein